MKILFVHHGTILGGAPLSLLYLARELERQPDIELEVVCHSPEMRDFFKNNLTSSVDRWPNPFTFVGRYMIGYVALNSFQAWKTFLFDLFRVPKSIVKQVRFLKDKRPDIVHLNSSVLFTTAIAARLAGVPIVWHVRECLQGAFWQKTFSGAIIRHMAHQVIAISHVEAQRLGQDHRGKVRVIYNPINFAGLKPELYDQALEKKKLGLKDSDNLVVNLGGLTPRKGTFEQVEAMQYTSENTKLIIAGFPFSGIPTNSYEQSIMDVISRLPEGKVVFAGVLDDVASLIAASDVLVFTGTKPHFPRPVFEAWRMKKPVIVFEMDGISNNVEHLVDGIVVKDVDGKSLGEAIALLLKDRPAMIRFGEAGRKKADQKCDPFSVSKQVLAVYEGFGFSQFSKAGM